MLHLDALTLWTSDFCLLILRNGQVKGKLLVAFFTFEIITGHIQPPRAKRYQDLNHIFFLAFVNILKNHLDLERGILYFSMTTVANLPVVPSPL